MDEGRYSVLCTSMLCFVVPGLESETGVESSGGSEVFVCEAALDASLQRSLLSLLAMPEPNMDKLPLD